MSAPCSRCRFDSCSAHDPIPGAGRRSVSLHRLSERTPVCRTGGRSSTLRGGVWEGECVRVTQPASKTGRAGNGIGFESCAFRGTGFWFLVFGFWWLVLGIRRIKYSEMETKNQKPKTKNQCGDGEPVRGTGFAWKATRARWGVRFESCAIR